MAQKVKKQDKDSASDLPFEDILGKLQNLCEQLEAGDLPLEQSLSLFEQGVSLSKAGALRLDEAERKVEILLQDEGDVDSERRKRVSK